MSSIEVKTKNGYVKIANNLFDNIIFRDFTNRERAVVCLIIRLSYGFNHKKAVIKPKIRFALTGLYRQNIDRTLDSLIAKNVIIDRGNDEYALNKHFDQWKVKLNKHFNEDDYNALKGLQFRGYVENEVKNGSAEDEEIKGNVITTITNCNQDNYKKCNKDDYKNGGEMITKCNQAENPEVITTITNLQKCNQDDYMNVITTITKTNNLSSPRLHEQPENEDGAEVAGGSKNIFKDNINTCIKDMYIGNTQKKVDPYFNNPVVEKFKSVYMKLFKKDKCYLDNFKINRLMEIQAENPDFINQLPGILEKYSKLNFSNGIGRPGLKWLINDGNWSGVMNGEYDQWIKGSEKELDGWTL